MKPFDRLAQSVAKAQDELLEQGDTLDRARARFLARPEPAPAGRRLWLGGVAGAATLAALLILVINLSATPEFYVGHEGQVGQVGQWITAREGAVVPLRFSDGSVLRLQPRSGMRVKDLDRRGAILLLERGAAEVQVVPRSRSRWSVDAGPFAVRVTGTLFNVSWDPAAGVFDLDLRQGRVIVRGPVLKERRFTAGETVRVWVEQGRMELNTSPPPDPPLDSLDHEAGKAPPRAPSAEPRPGETGGGASLPGPPAPASAAGVSGSPDPSSGAASRTGRPSGDPGARHHGAPARQRPGALPPDRREQADEPHPLIGRGDPPAGADLAPPRASTGGAVTGEGEGGASAKRPAKDAPARSDADPPAGPAAPDPKPGSQDAARPAKDGAPPAAKPGSAPEKKAQAARPPARPRKDQRSPFELARAGRYREAVEAARGNWPQILRGASAEELFQIGDAARLAGEGRMGSQALGSLRRRFPGTRLARLSAFFLGRLAFDQLRDYRGAARWFSRYLDEAPGGTLAHEALGRLMESRHRAKDIPGARRAACRYQQKYPKGPYADIARALCGSGGKAGSPPGGKGGGR